jgi:hypothetical protein
MRFFIAAAAVLPLATVSSFVIQPQNRHTQPQRSSLKPLFVAESSILPSCISSPVLQQIYPSLLQFREEYGHPNIPLGTSEGRMCYTLRRLQIQQKLNDEEIQLLTDLGFRFNSLEDVYFEFDFDEMMAKLVEYEQEHQNNYQIKKKYPQDPELGAWVTGVRRVAAEGRVDPDHEERLNAINFSWISTRKCGSKFMKQYRELVARVETESIQDILKESKIQTWIAAQREARRRGGLSDTRFHYMQQLIGDDWMEE